MKPQAEQLNRFLQSHRVFHSGELEQCCSVSGYHSRNLLSKLAREQRIKRLRNRLYATLPGEARAQSFMPPALLVAAKSTEDSVLAYQSALAFYGMSRNTQAGHSFLTRRRLKPYEWNHTVIKPCQPPRKVAAHHDCGVVEAQVWGTPVRVVSKERLLVDLLDRLDLSGGWEDICNAFQHEEELDYRQLLAYLRLLDNPAAAARVGYFLNHFQHSMRVSEEVLMQIEELKPLHAEYFFRSDRAGKLDKRWNLYIPDELLVNEESESYEF